MRMLEREDPRGWPRCATCGHYAWKGPRWSEGPTCREYVQDGCEHVTCWGADGCPCAPEERHYLIPCQMTLSGVPCTREAAWRLTSSMEGVYTRRRHTCEVHAAALALSGPIADLHSMSLEPCMADGSWDEAMMREEWRESADSPSG